MLKKIIGRVLNTDGSTSIDDPAVVKLFINNPNFPYLVSFSRTGSHWLRMIMELYFEKPSLVRAFFFKDASDFTCYHTHDMDLSLQRDNVIYLYRHPVETVYSQLCYYNEDPNDEERRSHWTTLYAHHLSKWLVHDDFTLKKTLITYESMKSNMHGEIWKICAHLGENFDAVKLDVVLAKVSKYELKKKTKHDAQVVNLTYEYQIQRKAFENKYGTVIMDKIYSTEHALANLF